VSGRVLCLLCRGLGRRTNARLAMRITTAPIRNGPPLFYPHDVNVTAWCPACDGSGWAKMLTGSPVRRTWRRRAPWQGLTLRRRPWPSG
jgi:hypothetical protein